jgi:predicted transcriptional regulator
MSAPIVDVGKRHNNLSDVGPTDRELTILKVLWEIGEGNVREVYERLTAALDLHFNTVQTHLRIMDGKGLVQHRRKGRRLIYRPIYTRDQEAARFLQRVFAGELKQLVLSMLAAEVLTSTDLAKLEAIISEAGRSRAKPFRRKSRGP